ncbi:hypothetical protein HBI24_082660 [Parastagonospora nodorum]|nr:hypothetical protein HBH76_149920 [Parastagonospora nodorum]KAH5283679.1 hypothetical protein HBI72_009380 [Parastagonospora nodorum]KAH5585801.1 hypothetical protein HBI24_082660 [Parastagonospora nodorum]KAH5654725.1 hypothetical protein HBI51_054390 [Parastagonospora nodorum]KAH6119868.1 hypothetical protein HBI69_080070 [Parastagonospora nodorum]
MSFAILWNATVCFSKLSVLLMYTAIMPTPSMIRSAWTIGGLIVCWNLGDILAGFLICRPLARNWDFTLEGTSGSQPSFYLAMGIINLVTDAVMIALPIPHLLRLKMATRKKILAIALFSVGIGTWLITIYRQTLLPGLDFTDMTYTGVLATILSGLEPSVAIALACIPLMRPLFRKAKSGGCRSTHGYNSDKSSGVFSAKKGRGAGRYQGSFIETVDDNDDTSEVHLQPMKPACSVDISTNPSRSVSMTDVPGQAITV